MKRIFDIRMKDGSRHFADLPETRDWDAVRDHARRLSGVWLTELITDHVTEAWVDFRYRGHQFSMNNQMGEWWFFVRDPACPEEVLEEVLSHFEPLLGNVPPR